MENDIKKKDSFEVRMFNEVILASKVETMYKAAAIVNKKPSQLYEWSSGTKTPKISTTISIAKKLGVNIEFPKIKKI